MDSAAKLINLKNILTHHDRIVLAFSGGVDSAFLLAVARECLGDRITAITVRSPFYPEREYAEAVAIAQQLGVRHRTVHADPLAVPGLAENHPDRCYRCKGEIFRLILAEARREGISTVAEGSNQDDLADFRPGQKALAELGIISPLCQARLCKAEIRDLARKTGLRVWDKPAYACLASRFPYGETITTDKLSRVEKAESFLFRLGLSQLRVRSHGDLARIEVSPKERQFFYSDSVLDQVNKALKELGFAYVSLDLAGYRMGSLNETLPSSR